jgi:hypothetical protein
MSSQRRADRPSRVTHRRAATRATGWLTVVQKRPNQPTVASRRSAACISPVSEPSTNCSNTSCRSALALSGRPWAVNKAHAAGRDRRNLRPRPRHTYAHAPSGVPQLLFVGPFYMLAVRYTSPARADALWPELQILESAPNVLPYCVEGNGGSRPRPRPRCWARWWSIWARRTAAADRSGAIPGGLTGNRRMTWI